MDGNLPPVLPSTGPPGGSSGMPPIQSMSDFGGGAVSSVNDIGGTGGGAMTSINSDSIPSQTSVSDYSPDKNTKTTSIGRIGQEEQRATTSVSHSGAQPTDEGGMTEQEKDERWYQASQKRMAEKRAKQARKLEKQVANQHTKRKGAFDISTGGTGLTFTGKGKHGFEKKLYSHIRKNKSSYKNLSREDQRKMYDIISKRIAGKRTGSAITRRDRIQMRRKAGKLWQQKQITKSDYKDMKRVISRLSSH